jgi:hypothetical protein
MGQIPGSEPLLVFDHISQNETKGVFLHHLVKPTSIERRKIRREKKTGNGILPEYLDSPRSEHFLHKSGVFYGSNLQGFNLFGQGSDFLS